MLAVAWQRGDGGYLYTTVDVAGPTQRPFSRHGAEALLEVVRRYRYSWLQGMVFSHMYIVESTYE